ncbi:Gfo/Idh/MocA family oxidoreductase [Cohnella lubricantis]|uniref:Gfo/Idh/MocA family oxidoreductase n=1 Tax=Cohnella lubricantis TaxID=2163172 RepID=A0A841TFX8_9BACL|nr:Gfo/Idh/MocA family oxidoreductase [Cohnella lubricantis]MBB6679005.1 Gfo/Idh/MocA family oxidoreductase [Cohnella lubricantis]MBP2119507.1 putative dehydrogenase [Cohnella lubricantis]
MGSSDQVRIGLIGAGNIGNVHLQEFGKLEHDCKITAITDAYLPLAEQRAKQYGIETVAPSPEALIARSDIDAVIIGVPNKYHAPLAVQALESGKHVLLEKPMGLDSAAAKDIVRAQRRTGKTLMVAHQMRWDWLPLQVKAQIERGELGHIYTAKTGWYRRKGIPGWGTWFTQHAESGGGPLIDIGVHMLDLAFHLMGEPKPISVYGSTYAEFGPRKKGIGGWGKPDWNGTYDVEDLATAIIKMDNGASLTLEVSWAVHMNTDSNPFVHLMGSEGGVYLSGNEGKFLMERFDQPIDVPLTTPNDDEGARVRLSRHFLECVREGKTPWTSAETGLRSNLIIDAIYESSRTGGEVKLDWSL